MPESPRLVQAGTAGGTAINVDVTTLQHAVPKRVQLTASYAILSPPGYPDRPGFTGTDAANLDYPRTIASGTILTLLGCEADALVAAGRATYV